MRLCGDDIDDKNVKFNNIELSANKESFSAFFPIFGNLRNVNASQSELVMTERGRFTFVEFRQYKKLFRISCEIYRDDSFSWDTKFQ